MRYILAGGPTCGKTSLIEELQRRGYRAIDEAAREVIKERKFKPGTSEFQIEIFKRQLQRENSAPPNSFFDRSALEGIAYSRLFIGEVPKPIREFDYSGRYSQVFLLERLPFQSDGERIEKNEEEAARVHGEIIKAYAQKDYLMIPVPLFPGKIKEAISQRADFILNFIEGKNGRYS